MNQSTLADFARHFVPALRPLLHPLQDSTRALVATRDQEIEQALVPELRDITHFTGVLLEKVEEQETYVLVFGPLKSGKSTLMNALAASYVSEVTALPAYPCMVFVSHAPTSSYELTRYDGTSEVLRDPSQLKVRIEQAHAELAREVTAAEERRETFEPARHYPRAIRRIDVRMPAEELHDSGAVLVDTPGLYSRMKFGYDLMTREFKNTAACAVFVVKTDNLFLEQVFQEFEELLDLFSRIFLVVNVDQEKRDLGPDGELVPSAEASNPERIVEAFRTFSMARRMREADEDGRLEIYTIDLLNAARRRMRGEPEDASSPVTVARLRDDLVRFLSSSEYIVAFLRDSMRQGEHLLDRLERVLESDALTELAKRLQEDRVQLATARERLDALQRLEDFDWDAATDEFGASVRREATAALATSRNRLSSRLARTVEEWFDTDDSLEMLLSRRAEQRFAEHLSESAQVVRERISTRTRGSVDGLELPGAVRADMERAGVALAPTSSTSFDGRIPVPGASRLTLDLDELPIRRGFLDWILLRSRASVRRRVFGGGESPDLQVTAATKERRLGGAGRDALASVLDRACAERAPAQEEAAQRTLLAAQRDLSLARVRAALEARRPDLARHVAELERRVGLAEAVIDPVRVLTQEAQRSRIAFETLLDRFAPERQIELEPQAAPAAGELDAEADAELAPLEGEAEPRG